MEEGEFNTEYFDKVNVKEIFGDVLGIKTNKLNNIDTQQYEKAMIQVEDKEDAFAMKQAVMEEKNTNAEGIQEFKELENEEKEKTTLHIQEDKLPPIV